MNKIPEELWEELITVAKEDGVISKDEEALLDNIKKNLEIYYDEMSGEGDTKRKGMKAIEAQLQILREAYETADMDGQITKDEYGILRKLQSIVQRMIEEG